MSHSIVVPFEKPYNPHSLSQRVPDLFMHDPERMKLFAELRRHRDHFWPTEDDNVRITQFIELGRRVRGLREGDYVEMGTHTGASAHWIWRMRRRDTALYCFDTFDGFPQEDMDAEREVYLDHHWTRQSFDPLPPLDMIRNTITGRQYDGADGLLHLVQGRIPMSLEGYGHLRFRFAHLDIDLFEPTRHAIPWLWERLVPRGVLVMHDYGTPGLPGVKKAADAFFEPLGIMPLPMGDRWGSAMVCKPWV